MIKVRVSKKDMKPYFEKGREIALRALGIHMQDATAKNTHRVTGLLANSWNYATSEYKSGFGNLPIMNPKYALDETVKVTQPSTPDRVRIGSGLVYASPYNWRFAVLEITVDRENNNLGKIASAAFAKAMK